jgi:cephalosporin hydroxylase
VKLLIDTDAGTLSCEDGGRIEQLPLYSTRSFELLSEHWVRVGWNQKYTYTFSWLGRPVIQLPSDLVRLQEVIYRLRPDVVVETGVAHGGSLVFYASLCKLLGHGRVIGIDVEIRPHNREAIDVHPLRPFITLVEGSSTDIQVVERVRSLVGREETALVLLDSNHTKAHVRAELEAYCPLVSPGSYIVATDGVMRDVSRAPRGSASWDWDNPSAAARDFLVAHPEFEEAPPPWLFNESELRADVTHWPFAWLRRKADIAASPVVHADNRV